MAAVILGAAVVLGLAIASASRAIGEPSATVLVDPFGAYSDVALPGWDSHGVHLRFPLRLLSVDDHPVGTDVRYANLPSDRIRALLRQRWEEGARTVRLRFGDGERTVEVVVPVAPITATQIWPLLALYAAMGLCIAACGFLVFFLARQHPGGRAYLLFAGSGFLFLTTFVDYHTRAELAPLFLLGYHGVVVALLSLAATFPSPPAWLVGHVRRWRPLCLVAVSVPAVWIVLAPSFGSDILRSRVLLSVGLAGSLLCLAIATTLRFFCGKPEERDMLRSALWGLGIAPIFIGGAMGMTMVTSSRMVQTVFPLGAFAIPLTIGYTLIKYNAFETGAIVTRRLVQIPIVLLAVAAATLVWLLFGALPGWAMRVLLPSLMMIGLVTALFIALRRLTNRLLFGSAPLFQPTIEELSDQLAHLRSPGEIALVLERLARQCVPVRSCRVVFPGDFRDIADFSLARLQLGEHYWANDAKGERQLLFPMRSLGGLRAVLAVGTVRGSPLFSSSDIDLLETISSVGAVALHNVESMLELDERQRLERAASTEEKRLALGTLAAEISHEIAYSLNYLRFLLRQIGSGKRPVAEDVDVGRDEVERLERMLMSLRRLRSTAPVLEPVPLLAMIRRAVVLVRDTLAERGLECILDIDANRQVRADPDAMLQLFANLLRNAARAVSAGGRLGVRAHTTAAGEAIDVWDNGPGVPEHLKESIFSPWVTTSKDGAGLGLAVCWRIARAHGWDLELLREEECTIFRVRTPQGRVES